MKMERGRYDRIKGVIRPSKVKQGSVLIVGGGIGGIQASLDLVQNGFEVYLVDSSPAIGGVMAQLDKTFPTNDCSMCILAPKLVECGRDLNIHLRTLAEVVEVKGEAGNFRVKILNKPRFIDSEKCTGCGECAKVCPTRSVDEFNAGLDTRRSIYVKYPQAVPRSFLIDRDTCIGCGLCENVCLAKAIRYEDEPKEEEIRVGAIILAPGFKEFDASLKPEYGYGRFPNVVTSVEFERILSASGPYGGHIMRPSDGKIPKKIAFLQCIGSRDERTDGEYCSAVCCMYATKEAIIAKEHQRDVEPTIFFMDMRAYGKGFERYYNRARDEYGIRYIRSRIGWIEEDDSKNLIIRYEDEDGSRKVEKFDMVVLSVGLRPPKDAEQIADRMGIELNQYGFADTTYLAPVETSRRGIFVIGAFQTPMDIPETVIEASCAVAKAGGLLADVRNTRIKKKEYPEERDVTGEEPRIGVFICHCGINIGAVVRVKEVVEYAKTLPGVVYAEDNLYTCSEDTQKRITEMIKEHNLNRVVVASCTPRTHEPLFQETLKNAGLNPYLFEMANIREQCSWAHMHEPDEATEKAKDLVRMTVAKAYHLTPLEKIEVGVIPKALVIGGGAAGLTAALDIARGGYEVYLVEKGDRLGGHLNDIHSISEVGEIRPYLDTLINQVRLEPKITLFMNSEVESVEGFLGNFKTKIITKEGKKLKRREIEHGVIIVAIGACVYKPKEYLYGKDERVITQLELEDKIAKGEMDFEKIREIVMIQCVGSRNSEHPYCSKFCCAEAMKNINLLFDEKEDLSIYCLYKDIRTYGFREKFYNMARDRGAVFIRYDDEHLPEVTRKGGKLQVKVFDPILKEPIVLHPDLLVLSTGIVPSKDNESLSKILRVPLNEDGFFLEAHVKLRPVDFATEGIFLCGLAHSPKPLDESIAQASAAAARATAILSKKTYLAEPIIAKIDEEKCIGCGLCVSICPQGAPELSLKEGGKKAQVIAASCKGCGTCAASCPQQAISMGHFTSESIMAQVRALAQGMEKVEV